jgi:Fur family iron response transcriptional regulator
MPTSQHIVDRLKHAGLRPTRQRLMLGTLLWCGMDRHVTAEQLHSEARMANMQVSMATVYNTLHQFVDAGLLKEVVVDGGRSYFDTNITPHHHFLYELTGELEDIPAERIILPEIPVPEGFSPSQVSSVDVIIRLRA